MDLSRPYADIRAVEGGSARAIARLTLEHDAYRRIGGGVGVNYHTLSDFRSANGEAFDALLTDSVAVLLAEGAVTLRRAAQEGTRIRASAGAASFRRGATLAECLEEARTPVERLKRQVDDPHARKEGDSEAVGAWRERMGTEEAKAIYKARAATASTPWRASAARPAAGARQRQGALRAPAACPDPQPHAYLRLGAPLARIRERCVQRIGNCSITY